MRPRDLAGLILASTLITFDGTAATVALPAIGRELGVSFSRLQWISNAPLLMLAAMLLPAGVVADRWGRVRTIRIGIGGFAVASFACAAAMSDVALITARLVQGASGALVLPAVLAALRAAQKDDEERTHRFGVWAAWTGVAGAAGPLLGGGLVDLMSWRAVFIASGTGALIAGLLLIWMTSSGAPHGMQPIPIVPTAALVVILGTLAYLLIEGVDDWGSGRVAFVGLLVASVTAAFARSPKRSVLFPRELLSARNCLPANLATFAFYFGMFGLSFLLALYTQQVLTYSGVWAAVALLPISATLFLAERFGRFAARIGTRLLVISGALIAAAGVFVVAAAPHPLPFWSGIIVATTLFGLGISLAVSVLTQAAVSAVSEHCAGAASGLNHATVRVAGLVGIALLGSLATSGGSQTLSVEGFQRAMAVCAAIVGLAGVVGGSLLRDDEPGGLGAA